MEEVLAGQPQFPAPEEYIPSANDEKEDHLAIQSDSWFRNTPINTSLSKSSFQPAKKSGNLMSWNTPSKVVCVNCFDVGHTEGDCTEERRYPRIHPAKTAAVVSKNRYDRTSSVWWKESATGTGESIRGLVALGDESGDVFSDKKVGT